MASKDLYNNISVAASILAQAVTAPVNGAGADLQGYGSATVIVSLGTFAGTTPAATVQVQDSGDDAVYTAVAASDLLGGALPAIGPTNDESVLVRGYIGRQRYLRVAVTAISGAGASLPIAADVVRGHPRYAPTT